MVLGEGVAEDSAEEGDGEKKGKGGDVVCHLEELGLVGELPGAQALAWVGAELGEWVEVGEE